MVGTILAIGSAAASIIGGAVKSHQARVANRRQQAQLDRLDAENQAYYNRRYYEDATQRADNQRAITQAREALLRNNQAVAGQSAVMGATNATAAAQKEANNNALANAISGVAANAQAYKTHVEDSYRAQDAAIRNKNAQLEYQRGLENQAAVDGAVNGFNTLAQSYIAGDTNLEGSSGTTTAGVEPKQFVDPLAGTKGQETVNTIKANVENSIASRNALPTPATSQAQQVLQGLKNNMYEREKRNALDRVGHTPLTRTLFN